jgi:hypothetical protein
VRGCLKARELIMGEHLGLRDAMPKHRRHIQVYSLDRKFVYRRDEQWWNRTALIFAESS